MMISLGIGQVLGRKQFRVYLPKEIKKYHIYFYEICENILKNVPKQNQVFVKKQFNKPDENFTDYLYY